MKSWIFLALLMAPMVARASIIEVDTSGVLDAYTGTAYLIPQAFAGDPTTLTSLDFRANVGFSERMQVVGGDGRFTLHYDATMFGRTLASGSKAVVASGGYYATSLDFGFAGVPVLPDPEVSVAVWLTPDVGYFASDSAPSIGGSVYLQTFYDPPSVVAEPGSIWLLAGAVLMGMLTGCIRWADRVPFRRALYLGKA